MQFFSFLTLLTTAECTFWRSAFLTTSRNDGLKASASGFLRLKASEQLGESVKQEMPSDLQEDELLLHAEASASLDALQFQPENTTQSNCSVELYQHGDFAGWNVVFASGAYDHQQMVDKGALNDDASAIRVIGTGCCAEVYEHGDFTGWQVEFPEGQYDHYQMAHRGVPNDKLSSLNVFLCADKPESQPDVDTKPETPTAVEPTVRSAEEEARAAKIKAERSIEGNLIKSLMHSGPGGEEEMGCVTACRYGETRLTWKDCIDWCVQTPRMRSTLVAMLPRQYHKAHAQHVEMPEILKTGETHKKQRSSEL
mmetsp:Transcript_11283/g.21339  ORF Transcript_11283/g.21339 Transcript_11283/m.21339 type:complete len:311 (-) Transcript_11283:37-969(-)